MVLQEATNHACVLLERSITMGPLRSFGDQRPELSQVSYGCHLTTRIGRQMTFSVISRYELNRIDPSEYVVPTYHILYHVHFNYTHHLPHVFLPTFFFHCERIRQERHQEALTWGTDPGAPNPHIYPPNSDFPSDFGHSVVKMLANLKKNVSTQKK